MCYLASFTMNAAKVISPSEEREGVSIALSHLKENDTIWFALKRAVFDRLKGCFLH